MREELPMDYIDLLKRVAIPLGTIMVLSSALAQEQLTKADLVQLAVTLGVYDNRCEKLAPRLLADVQRMVRMLDKDDVMAAVINEQDKVDRAGEATWCVALRPVVEKYKDGLFEPVRWPGGRLRDDGEASRSLFDAVALMTGLMPLVRKLEARLAADVEFKGADA
jgi:hypothetical protein